MNNNIEQSKKLNNPSQDSSSTKKKSRFLHRTFIAIIAIICLFAISVISLLTTDKGTKWSLDLAQKFVKGLSLGEIQGNIQSGLKLANIQFQNEGIDTKLNQVDLKLNLTCLLTAQICVDYIYLDNPQIHIQTALLPKTNSTKQSKSAVQKVELPISIDVTKIKIENLDLHIDDSEAKLGLLETGFQLNNQQGLTLSPTQINNLSYRLNTKQQLKPSEQATQPLDLEALKQRLSQPLLTKLNQVILPFDINITQLEAKNWQLKQVINGSSMQEIEITELQLQAKATDEEIQLTQLNLISSIANLKGHGNAQLQQDFPINLNLYAKLLPFKLDGIQVLPESTMDLVLSGNLKKSTALSVKIQGDLEANLVGEAQLSTAKTPFNLKLTSSKFDYPFDKKEKLLKIRELNFGVNGNLVDSKFSLQGKISNIEDKPLHINLQAKTNLSELSIEQLNLDYANNHINANGYLSQQQNELNIDINAANLSGLIPHFSANLIGKVNLKGNLNKPNLTVDLVGNTIQWRDLKIAKLILKGDVKTEQQVQANLILDLHSFSQGEAKLNQVGLQLTGNEQSHHLQLRSKGEPVAANFDIKGNFDRSKLIWAGQLSQTSINTIFGDIKPNKNIELSFDYPQKLAQISDHCWKHNSMELCFPQKLNLSKIGEIPFELKSFDLAFVNQLAKQENLLRGKIRSQGKLAWHENELPKFNMQLEGNDLSIAYKIDYRTFKLSIPKLTVDTQLNNNELQVKSDISVQNNGRINADLNVHDITNQRKLSGNLNIQNIALSLANQLLSNDEKVTGTLATKLKFAGDLTVPLLDGAITVRDLKTKMKSSPVQIEQADVDLNFYGDHSSLQADIQTTGGMLSIEGEADWRNPKYWQAYIKTKANQLLVNIPTVGKIRLSPDITITASPNLLDLLGDINIPWARINIESLPDSAVKVSDDEIILDGKNTTKDFFASQQIATTTKSGLVITSDLNINIGDDVQIKAYGLKSQLDGTLSIRQEKGNLGLFGQINLKNGRYASFGQDLLIRKGQIHFSGMPSQPLLDIEAIRNPESMDNQQVTAGVKVTGVADSPNVDVFSEPSMSQDQALSYLLTGRSLENSGDAGSGGSMGAALLGLGLAKSGKLVGSIGETFGIQDLNLGTSGVGANSKVVVSGNITPRLKVKYGVGLFDGLAEVTLRYRLFPRLFLQSVSGVNQAVDLLYEFEF